MFAVLSRYLDSSANLRRACIGIGALFILIFSICITNSAFIDISLFRYGQDQSLAVFLMAIFTSIFDLLLVSWTVLSWKIPVMIGGPEKRSE